MEYFVYCRKSSEGEERQALSLPAQERELKQYAVENRINVKKIFKEAKSARVPNKREKFDLMIEKIKQGECDRILCWHTNRLSRNPLESGVIIQLLTDGVLKEILTPQKSITTNNANDILLGVEFGSNSQYSKDLSVNVKRGIREKINRGQWPTRAPLFYINVGRDKLSKNIEPNPESAPYFEKWVDKIIEDKLTYKQATELINRWGVKKRGKTKFSKSSVHRLLQSPVYYGLLEYGDYPATKGNWKPLISKEKWDQLQEVLNDISKPNQSKWYHPYKKLMKCGKCGLQITAYTKKKGGRHYNYYTCTKKRGNCGNSPVKPNILEQQFRSILRQIKITDATRDKLRELTEQKLKTEFEFEKNKDKELNLKKQDINQKLDNLLNLRLGGEISKNEYIEKKKELNKELLDIQELVSDLSYNREDVREQLELFFDSCFNIEKVFNNGTEKEKRKIISNICKDIILEDGEIGLNFKKPWSYMLEINNSEEIDKWYRYGESNPGFRRERAMS